MFCTKCGNEIPDNTICPCQQPAEQPQPQPQPQQPQQQYQQQPPPPPPQQQQYQQQPPPPPPQQQYQQQPPPPQYQQQPPPPQQYQQPQYNMPPADNRKLYCILSYVGILWLIGMLAQNEKSDPRVRFHVGQGIILTIYSVGLSLITGILMSIIGAVWKTTSSGYWGFVSYRTTHPAVGWIGWILQLAVWGSVIFLIITAILNINKNTDKPLPVIGKFAFYK